jgi:hypothetical protein
MSLQHLKLDAISESDLTRLVNDGVSETKTLEYKKALTYVTDDDKRELLSDITALANADGGDIIFGLEANRGIAMGLPGLRNFVSDDAIGKIENLMRDSLQPRIVGIRFQPLLLSVGTHALIIRVPRSFAAPHMVRHKGVTRFCGRNTNGKYDLDIHELRSAFLANETYAERLRSFRLDRINKLISGESPVKLKGDRLTVLHLLPITSVANQLRLTPTEFRFACAKNVRPIGAHGWGTHVNFEGVSVAAPSGDGSYHSYVQLWRTGFLEATESSLFEMHLHLLFPDQQAHRIPSTAWEGALIQALPGYMDAMAVLQIPPPFVLSLSLLNVRNLTMAFNPRYIGNPARAIDRDHLICDEALIESLDLEPAKLLRPFFDQVWNACGWPGSLNYDENGNWREH